MVNIEITEKTINVIITRMNTAVNTHINIIINKGTDTHIAIVILTITTAVPIASNLSQETEETKLNQMSSGGRGSKKKHVLNKNLNKNKHRNNYANRRDGNYNGSLRDGRDKPWRRGTKKEKKKDVKVRKQEI